MNSSLEKIYERVHYNVDLWEKLAKRQAKKHGRCTSEHLIMKDIGKDLVKDMEEMIGIINKTIIE